VNAQPDVMRPETGTEEARCRHTLVFALADGSEALVEVYTEAPPTIAFRESPFLSWGPPVGGEEMPRWTS